MNLRGLSILLMLSAILVSDARDIEVRTSPKRVIDVQTPEPRDMRQLKASILAASVQNGNGSIILSVWHDEDLTPVGADQVASIAIVERHRDGTRRTARRDSVQFSPVDEKMGFAVVFCRDSSDSVSPEATALANQAIGSLAATILGAPNAKCALIDFASEIVVTQPLTSDIRAIRRALSLSPTSGGTRLYDALSSAVSVGRASWGVAPAIVILLTDGADTASTVGVDDAIRSANGASIAVFTVGLGRSIEEPVLRHIADSANGLYAPVAQASDLDMVYRRMGSVLKNAILVRYESSARSRDDVEIIPTIVFNRSRTSVTAKARRGVQTSP